jgi:cytochrome c peroxidase
MRHAVTLLVACLALAGAPARAAPDLAKEASQTFKPIPARAPVPKGNVASPARTGLGKMLYFDPRLSSSQLISCNTCHNVGLGGADLQETSIGHGWQKGPRNAPTVLNAVYNVAQFWDGRAEDLQAQAKGPVQASVEMNNSPARLIETLKSIPGYAPYFQKAFPGEKDPITFDNVARAIEAFEATLVTPGSRFDRYLLGDRKALRPDELAGLALFMDKGCAACHGGVNVGGAGYFPFGVVETPAEDLRPAGDKGRFKVTQAAGDEYVFRSPSLRNVDLTPPYFHSGKVWKLDEAVRIMGSTQLGVGLNEEEVSQVTAFLRTLTGKQPQVEHPLLPPGTNATPRPVIKVSAN